MTIIRYDGSFEGFLCAAALTIDGAEPSGFLWGEGGDGGLFDQVVAVASDRDAALAFFEHIVREVSRDAFATARHAFHSEAAVVELLLWRYLRLGFRVGRRLEGMKADPLVQPVQQLARRVEREVHRFLGFVRFREVEWSGGATLFYAPIEPETDVLPFLAPHFADRLADRPWVIHDLRRGQALFCEGGRVKLLRGVELAGAPRSTKEEDVCAALWQGYFKRLAIEARRNPDLQRQLVPLRHRKHLTEFGDSSSGAATNEP